MSTDLVFWLCYFDVRRASLNSYATESIFEETPVTQVKDYWNSRPCNIRHSVKPVGTREYFDEVEARKHFVEPHIPKFAEFERWNGKRSLKLDVALALQ